MPPKASQETALSTEQVQLLRQVIQYSESPKKESWDVIAQELNIINGNAAQQRFRRLLKTLRSADPSGKSDGGTLKPKEAGKRSAIGKQNGTNIKRTIAKTMHAKEEDEEENEDDLGGEETPSKKRKSRNQGGTPKWKSIFARGDDDDDDDDVKVEVSEDSEDDTNMARSNMSWIDK